MTRRKCACLTVITAFIAIVFTFAGFFTPVEAASPARVSDISIQVTSRPLAKLTWSKLNCDGYKVYRDNKAIARVEAGSADDQISYVDDSIAPAGSYKYYVRSYNIENGKEVYGSSSPVVKITGGYTYESAGTGKVKLTGYTGHDQKLVIPDTIDGKAVTEIGDGCFSGNAWPKRVTVPEGVIRLGNYSFESCSLIQKVFLPDSLETIGEGAFSGCGSLVLADMNEGITSIGDGAFLACLDLSQVVLPASLRSLGKYSFALCESLSLVKFMGEDNKNLTEIPERAFCWCSNLQKMNLPSGVTKIGKRAFFKCNELSSLGGNLYLTEIGDYAFEETQVRNIYPILADDCACGFGVFAKNETDSFQAEYNDADKRYESCFGEASHVFLPSSVILKEGTFYGSTINGIEINDGESPANYKLIDGSLYSSDGKTLLVYFPTEINEDYTYVQTDESLQGIFHVPEGVERIASYAFFNCGLKKIYLPSTVTDIGEHAFTRSGINPDGGQIVDMDDKPLDLSTISVSDNAFDKWSLTYEGENYPEPSETPAYSFEPATHGPFPGTYSVTSLAGDKSLYSDKDFEGYADISADFDKWCQAYMEANSDIMPMDYDLKTLAPYCNLYKGDNHYNQMASILNGDAGWIPEAVKHAGYEYEEMYRIVDHGLLTELTRGRIYGNLLLYSGVSQACVETIAGVEPGKPVSTEDLINAIGSVYTEKAMMSTSASSSVSYGFSEDSGVMLYILASKEALDSLGTFCVDCFNGASGNGGEEEILFNAGARLKVLDVGTSEFNVWGQTGTRTYIIVQLLEDEKDPSEPLDGETDPEAVKDKDSTAPKTAKKANPLPVKGKTLKVKYKKLKKKTLKLPVSKIIARSKSGHGKKSYKLVSSKKGKKNFRKYFRINKKTGRLRIKKGLKKGTYKLKVKVRAAGNKVYKASPVKTIKIKIKVK